MAVRFHGVDESYSTTAGLPTSTYTICAWIIIDTDLNAVSGFWRFLSGGTEHSLDTPLSGVDVRFRHSTTNVTVRTLAVGTWAWVAISVSGTAGNAYHASAAETNLTTTSLGAVNTLSTPTSMRIGRSASTQPLDGRVAAFKMWTAQLTLAELERERYFYVPHRTTNLVHWHPFVNAELKDYSGSGNDLTLGTGAATEDGPPSVLWAPPALLLAPAAAAATNVNAPAATGTGAANAPTASIAANASNAVGTGPANAPSVSVTVQADCATGSGAAGVAGASVAANAGNAAGAGTAYAPSITASGNALPSAATGTGAANTPSASIAANAGNAAATGAANAPSISASGNAVASAATGPGTAYGPRACLLNGWGCVELSATWC